MHRTQTSHAYQNTHNTYDACNALPHCGAIEYTNHVGYRFRVSMAQQFGAWIYLFSTALILVAPVVLAIMNYKVVALLLAKSEFVCACPQQHFYNKPDAKELLRRSSFRVSNRCIDFHDTEMCQRPGNMECTGRGMRNQPKGARTQGQECVNNFSPREGVQNPTGIEGRRARNFSVVEKSETERKQKEKRQRIPRDSRDRRREKEKERNH